MTRAVGAWAVVAFAVTSTLGQAAERTGAEHLWLSRTEIARTELRAAHGDVRAAMALSAHFEHFGDYGSDEKWRRRAMELGSPVAAYNFAAILETDEDASLEALSDAECWLSRAIEAQRNSGVGAPSLADFLYLRDRIVERKVIVKER